MVGWNVRPLQLVVELLLKEFFFSLCLTFIYGLSC
jgi:hypothetical protein